MPTALRAEGYWTANVGKVLHPGVSVSPGFWNVFDHNHTPVGIDRQTFGYPYGAGPAPPGTTDADSADYDAAQHVAALLGNQTGASPFAIFAGLHRPHYPFTVPQEYYDLYPLASIVDAGFPDSAMAELPDFALQFVRGDNPQYTYLRIQAYLASVSFADAMLGHMLDAMDATGLWSTTTVVFWSDHGYQMGDHDAWAKFTLWEEAANAPLIIVDPDQTAAGGTDSTPVSLNQLFPTIMDLAGLPRPQGVSSESFAGLIDPGLGAYTAKPVLTYIYGSLSMRQGDHRLIRYEDGSLELYDLVADPQQVTNLALDPAQSALVQSLWDTLRLAGISEGIRFNDVGNVLNGTTRDEWLVADDQVTVAAGGKGDDVYFVTSGTTVVENAGEGYDQIVLRSSMTAPDTVFRVPKEVEALRLGMYQGTASVLGHFGNDNLLANTAAMSASGRDGYDVIRGWDRDDQLFGGIDDDLIYAGRGNDILGGGVGNDRLYGGAGDDSIREGKGFDTVDPGAGFDTISIMPGTDSVRIFNFDAAEDVLALEGFSFPDAAAALQGFVQLGASAVLQAEGTTIILQSYPVASLHAGIFLLLPASRPLPAQRPARVETDDEPVLWRDDGGGL
jgi:arylsulfatase A-like enzyme